jgi:PadR family transcriptional regulator PadR
MPPWRPSFRSLDYLGDAALCFDLDYLGRRMKSELLHGTLEVMILKMLSWGPMHGFGIGRWIEQLSGEEIRVEEGSLYPALYRMEKKGWIDSSWGLSDNQRRAKFYRLTPKGRRQLADNSTTWSAFARAVARVLSATQQPA